MRRLEKVIAAGTAVAALSAGCSAGIEGTPRSVSYGNLELAYDIHFKPITSDGELDRTRESMLLRVGTKVVGICVEYTSSQSATVNTGRIRVEHAMQLGAMHTIARREPNGALLGTFVGNDEDALVRKFGYCGVAGQTETRRARAA